MRSAHMHSNAPQLWGGGKHIDPARRASTSNLTPKWLANHIVMVEGAKFILEDHAVLEVEVIQSIVALINHHKISCLHHPRSSLNFFHKIHPFVQLLRQSRSYEGSMVASSFISTDFLHSRQLE